MSLIEECRQIVGLDSTPSHGNGVVAEFAASLCEAEGFSVELDRETKQGAEQVNLIARRPGMDTGLSPLILQAHLDTSDPGSFSSWTMTQANPFNLSIYKSEIFGLGVAGGKIDFLCQLHGFKKATAPLRRGVILLGTYGGHSGMGGALRAVRKKRIEAGYMVVGAPTDLVVASRGMGEVTFEVRIPFTSSEKSYRQQHDLLESISTQSKIFHSRPTDISWGLQDNPIVRVLDYLEQLPQGIALMDLDGGVEPGTWPTSAALEIDVVGGIESKSAGKLIGLKALLQLEARTNAIHLGLARTDADQIRIGGTVRIAPEFTRERAEAWLAGIRRACAEFDTDFQVLDYKQGFKTAPQGEWVGLCQEIGRQVGGADGVTDFDGSCEANIFSRLGIECVAFGPGKAQSQSRSPNEKIEFQKIDAAVNFYAGIVERMCL